MPIITVDPIERSKRRLRGGAPDMTSIFKIWGLGKNPVTREAREEMARSRDPNFLNFGILAQNPRK